MIVRASDAAFVSFDTDPESAFNFLFVNRSGSRKVIFFKRLLTPSDQARNWCLVLIRNRNRKNYTDLADPDPQHCYGQLVTSLFPTSTFNIVKLTIHSSPDMYNSYTVQHESDLEAM